MPGNLSKLFFLGWLTLLVLLFVPPRNPPGSSPVRAAEVAPYAAVAYEDFPWPPLPEDDPYYPKGCLVSRAAVTAQGVGE